MRKDNEQDLLITKFRSSPKEKQDQLLKFLFTDSVSIDSVVDFLNNKKLSLESKNFSVGDLILIDPFKLSSYPEIDIEYYRKNNLLVNNQYVQVLVEYINPVNNNPGLRFYTKQHNKEMVVETYSHYIDDQKSFEVII
jgi:hypothetical protein